MRVWLRRLAFVGSLAGVAAALSPQAAARGDKGQLGSFRLAKRVANDGKTVTGPEVVGFLTFTKTRRTVIMKWNAADGTPVSIAFIGDYSMSGETYCESVVYGVQSNLGAPGVSYDTPSETKTCTTAIYDGSGLSFDVPKENLRLRVGRDGIIATTPRWTDYWVRVK